MGQRNLKLAIQRKGRLTEDSILFLRKSGLDFDNGNKRLFSSCRNFPLEIIYARVRDIPQLISEGSIDLGIVGQNLLYEQKTNIKSLLNLKFGYCSLVIAVPNQSKINTLNDLKGKTIATSYPYSAQKFFQKKNILINIKVMKGSVEIAPKLGIAESVIDLMSTGNTLALNNLRVLYKIYDSEAVLVANETLFQYKKSLISVLINRFKRKPYANYL